MIVRALLIASVVFGVGCKKADDKPKKAPATAVLGADGLRHIAIEAGQDGYAPDTIKGKPGEKLVLVFTRTVEGDCLAKVKTPDGKEVALPMNQPTDVAITVPQTGKVEFACAMDMFKGVIVADPS
jgi:plastocyanin domain-containing protein